MFQLKCFFLKIKEETINFFPKDKYFKNLLKSNSCTLKGFGFDNIFPDLLFNSKFANALLALVITSEISKGIQFSHLPRITSIYLE